MRDHKARRPRHRGTRRRSVGVRELKAHAAGILREVREEGRSYLVTHRGRAIGVILPVDSEEASAQASEAADASAAWEAFLRAGRALERRFGPGGSGVRVLSDMRR